MTGLCTQANNSVIVDDPDLAADFLNEWNLLKDAGNAYPPSLETANSTSRSFNVDGGRITQWFAPTSAGQDLDYARQLINAAKEGILFLFFNPGVFVAEGQPEEKWTLLQNILFRHHQGTANFNAGLYIRGVVNQEIAGLTTESTGKPSKHAALDPSSATPVTLFNGGNQPPQRLGYDSMVPANIKSVFHDWATEMLGAGVHIHSKVVVLDPFGVNPVVMTGSHNLGYKASTANDDNLMIIEGNAPLAAAYAANIIAIYQAYRWNAYVEAHRQDPKVWHGLVEQASWQNDYLTGDHLSEIQFWLGLHAAPPPPPPGGPAARTATATGPAPTPPRSASKSGPKRAPKAARAGKKKGGARKAAAKKKKAPAKKHKRTGKKSVKKKLAKKKSAKKKSVKTKKKKR
jgi:phosphatidylserine/phosphatidylglycerophosphate/cardiolipin synthase-like enzyme